VNFLAAELVRLAQLVGCSRARLVSNAGDPLTRVVQCGMLFGLLVACGDNRPQSEPRTVQRHDSAGVLITETSHPRATTPIGWTVAQVPDLQLGSAEGGGTAQFHRIGGRSGGITGLADGRIAVVDAGSGNLLFFGRDGRFLNRVSIKGSGPGEFRVPSLVPFTAIDSLLIHDTGHRRYTLFSNDGQTHRSFTADRPGVMVGTVAGASPSGLAFVAPFELLPRFEGQNTRRMLVKWIHLESGHVDTVAQFDRELYFEQDLGGIPHELSVPFSTGPSAAVGLEGVFVTGGDAPDVRAFDNSGRLIRIFRVAESARRVTPEDIAGAIDSLVSRFTTLRSEARRVYARMNIPSHWPAFQSVRVDRLGWIWAELYRPPHHLTPRWMVFDSSGVARGTVDLPPQLEVHDIGPDYVLGRWLDDLGVEYVRRYRLDRSES
jgi:hypothetical protein